MAVHVLLVELLAEVNGLPDVLASVWPELLADYLATIFQEDDDQEVVRCVS